MPTLTIELSSTEDHLLAHQDVFSLIDEAWKKSGATPGQFFAASIDMGREVGLDACTPNDETAQFAFREGRSLPSRTTFGTGIPTQLVTLIAAPSEDGEGFELITAWIGRLAPREPHDPACLANEALMTESVAFWERHALILPASVPTFRSDWSTVVRMARNMPSFVNLTPHELQIQRLGGSIQTIPRGTAEARLSEGEKTTTTLGFFMGTTKTFGEVLGLPEPVEGTIFITSALVRDKVPHRTDVVSPGDPVRVDGRPQFRLGAQGFNLNP